MCSISRSVVLLRCDCVQGAMVRLGQVWWGYKVNHSSINSTTITRNFYFFEDCIYFVEAIFLDIIFDLFSRILNYFEDEVSLRQFILKTVYPGTVYPQDSLSSRQFILGQFILRTVYPQDSLSSRQFILGQFILGQFILRTVYPQDSLSSKQFILRLNCLWG